MNDSGSSGAPALFERLERRFADWPVELSRTCSGEPRLGLAVPRASEVLRRLREEPELALESLLDLTAIDRLGGGDAAAPRFELVYALATRQGPDRLRVHVQLEPPEAASDRIVAPSVVSLWPAAAWLEREVFDLFGIAFEGHADLRRILLDPDFEGAPLRKDHPLAPARAPLAEPAT